MRKPHILEPSKKTMVPERMIFFDSESAVDTEITQEEISRAIEAKTNKEITDRVRKDHNPYLITATFYRDRRGERGKIAETDSDYFPLKDGEDFLFKFWQDVDRFAQKGKKTYIFAHNAKYDVQITGCVPFLVTLGYTVKGFSDSNPFILKFCKEFPTGRIDQKTGKEIIHRKHLIILSSTNFYAQPLAKLGKTFNLPKLDFDHGQEILPESEEFMLKALTYGRRDVEILKAAMLAFISFVKNEGMGKFSMTVAGQAFAAYRQRFMLEDIYIHDDARAIETERNTYAGGRNECFTIGEVPHTIYYVDINSMYPHVMKNNVYPTKLVTFWTDCDIETITEKITEGYLICADVLVNTDIPIFHKKDDRLIFPIGEFWTSLSTPEIMEGITRGLIKEFKNICIYEAGDIFSRFVDYFYTGRLKAKHEGDAVHDNLFKIFLNSLYGKFGQRNENWEIVKDEDGNEIEQDPFLVMERTELDFETRETITYKIFGGRAFAKNNDEDDMEAMNSFPAIAAHVTGNARMLLWSYIEAAGIEHVHYCDTDSLFVDATGYQALWLNDTIDPDRLGALKIEDTAEDLKIFGCKDYFFNEKEKIKGVNLKTAVRIEDSPEGNPQYAVTQWGGFSDRLKSGDFMHYHNHVMIKELKREYEKGEIVGNRVHPFVLDEAAPALEDSPPLLLLTPDVGSVHYAAYAKLPQEIKWTYFDRDDGQDIDEWMKHTGLTLNCLTI